MNPENLNTENISTQTPKMINKEFHRYCIIPLYLSSGDSNLGPISLRFSANMKIFKHSSSKNDSYSLGITIPDELLDRFRSFEKRINELAFFQKNEVKKLNSGFGNFNKGDFHLVKEDKSGKPNIYAKLYVDRDNFSAPFFRVVDGNKKQRISDSLGLVGVPLNGKIVLRIKQLFCGGVKALTCVVQ